MTLVFRSLIAVLFLSSLVAAQSGRRPPNFVVIFCDDLGYGDLGSFGNPTIRTPNLDRMAAEGQRWTSFYSADSVCTPSRAALLTGRLPIRTGMFSDTRRVLFPDSADGLPHSEVTIAELLKTRGYATAAIGKWHLGWQPEFLPTKQGFDSYFGIPYSNDMDATFRFASRVEYFKFMKDPKREYWNVPLQRNEQVLERPTDQTTITERYTDEAIRFIGANRNKPFFLYLTFNAVHTPMHATGGRLKEFASIQNEKRRTYAAMMSAMDDAVGAVLKKLGDSGLQKNTLIFFVSDNGGPQPANASDNGELHGNKATTWEGGVRVPFLVQWPARLPAGKTYDHPVIQLDFFPTILAAAGIEATLKNKLDGTNLLPHLDGTNPQPPHNALYWRFGQQMAIRVGDWKLTKARDGGGLFNLATDIGERKDLGAEQPDKFKELTAAYEAWNKELREPLWGAGAAARARGKNKDKGNGN